jgi:hypothetical protein
MSEAPDEAKFVAVARYKRHVAGGGQWPEFSNWKAMLNRCENPNETGYSKYGARGVTVCERYHHFDAFIQDMGRKPSPEHSIDRIDSRGNYDVGNVRWATHQEQVNNPTNKPRSARQRMAPEEQTARTREGNRRRYTNRTDQENERDREGARLYRATGMIEEQRERKRERDRKRDATRAPRLKTEQQLERKREADRLRRSTGEYKARAKETRKPRSRTDEQKERRRQQPYEMARRTGRPRGRPPKEGCPPMA